MTNDEMEKVTNYLSGQLRQVPGIDSSFIRKCVTAINSLGDPEVESKIHKLIRFIGK